MSTEAIPLIGEDDAAELEHHRGAISSPVESLVTELLVALVVRTRRPLYRSGPGTLLLLSSLGLIVFAFAMPYLPGIDILGFVPLPTSLLGTVAMIPLLYVIATELMKRWFYASNPSTPATDD